MINYGLVAALSGWLLVAPGFNVDAPLERWRQVQAFDTARECETAKRERWSQALNEVANQLPYPPYPKLPKAEAPSQGETAPKEKTPPSGDTGQPEPLPTSPQRKSLDTRMQEILTEEGEQEKDKTQDLFETIREVLRKPYLPAEAPKTTPTPEEAAPFEDDYLTRLRRSVQEVIDNESRPEYRKAREGVDAAREPKQREINERYRQWKCVPADAVYQVPK